MTFSVDSVHGNCETYDNRKKYIYERNNVLSGLSKMVSFLYSFILNWHMGNHISIHYFSQNSQTCPKSYVINKCNYGVRLIMITFRNFPAKNKIYRNKFRILCSTYYCISFLYFCLKDIKLQLQNTYWFSTYHRYKRNILRYSAVFFF